MTMASSCAVEQSNVTGWCDEEEADDDDDDDDDDMSW